MENDSNHLINTPDLEKENTQLKRQNAALLAQLKQKDDLLEHYLQQFRLLQTKQFGSSSEKNLVLPEQLSLFNEAEITADEKQAEPDIEQITYARRKAKRTKEESLEQLVTEEVLHDLDDAEKVCPDCDSPLKEVKVESRYELKIIPARVEVIKHRTPVYACNSCDGHNFKTNIVKSKAYEPFLPKSSAAIESIAWILEQKYAYGMPIYRLEQQARQMNLDLSRQTMSNWVIKTARLYIRPVYEFLRNKLLSQSHLCADESPLQVLNEPGRKATQKSYMWLFATGRGSPPIIVYNYQTTRASKHPVRFLTGFNGLLQIDGYQGYNKLPASIELAGCFAHARRKYTDILKSLPKNTKTKDSLAEKAIKMIGKLYAIERQLKEKYEGKQLDEPALKDIYETRQKHSKPICDEYFNWCRQNKNKTGGSLFNAIKYSLNEEKKLRVFLDHPICEIDNNRAERYIKPYVTGRKAWLFANSTRGAESSAMIFSLVITAKENKLKIFDYLVYLFEQLAANRYDLDMIDLEPLMPWSDQLPKNLRISK
ncbi:MAG: IS66 family transposase [Eubacteriales bacterium]|nr:IS66 family transposase [Eubacteriales bacterium]